MFKENISGITIHCNSLPDEDALEKLFLHCNIRKYATKTKVWHGLILNTLGTSRAAVVVEGEWKQDTQMDLALSEWKVSPQVDLKNFGSARRKIGRNDLCLCGSKLKYKKCCINSEKSF